MEDIEQTESFILANDFDFVGISIYQPLPGTKIYRQLIAEKIIPPGFIPGHYQEVTLRRKDMSNELLRDTYNRSWNSYREQKGLPLKNRQVASIREHPVLSQYF